MGVPGVCNGLAWSNFGNVGQCFVEQVLFGDIMLAGLLIAAIFLFIMVKHNLPLFLILPVSWILSFTLWMMSGGSSVFLAFFLLSSMLNGGVIIVAILNYLNR